MMEDALRARLREAAKKKRGKLLKDVTADELLVAIDYVQEVDGVELWTAEALKDSGRFLRYFKYMSGAQANTIKGRVPHIDITVTTPGGLKTVTGYQPEFVTALIRFVVGADKVDRYTRSVYHAGKQAGTPVTGHIV